MIPQQPMHRADCPARHQTFAALARCTYHRADEVTGEGPYAVVYLGAFWEAVFLLPSIDDARDMRTALNEAAAADNYEAATRIDFLELGAKVTA